MYTIRFLLFVGFVASGQANAIANDDEVLAQIVRDVELLKAEVVQLTAENRDLKKLIADIEPRTNASTVGFSVVKTSVQRPTTEDEVITWDVMLSNYGDGFNLVTNSFICPIAGVYFFSFNLYSNGGNNGQACSGTLVLDGANQVRAQGRVQGPDEVFMTVSNSALFACTVGQRVSIQSGANNNVIGSDSGRTSSFNGYLVYET